MEEVMSGLAALTGLTTGANDALGHFEGYQEQQKAQTVAAAQFAAQHGDFDGAQHLYDQAGIKVDLSAAKRAYRMDAFTHAMEVAKTLPQDVGEKYLRANFSDMVDQFAPPTHTPTPGAKLAQNLGPLGNGDISGVNTHQFGPPTDLQAMAGAQYPPSPRVNTHQFGPPTDQQVAAGAEYPPTAHVTNMPTVGGGSSNPDPSTVSQAPQSPNPGLAGLMTGGSLSAGAPSAYNSRTVMENQDLGNQADQDQYNKSRGGLLSLINSSPANSATDTNYPHFLPERNKELGRGSSLVNEDTGAVKVTAPFISDRPAPHRWETVVDKNSPTGYSFRNLDNPSKIVLNAPPPGPDAKEPHYVVTPGPDGKPVYAPVGPGTPAYEKPDKPGKGIDYVEKANRDIKSLIPESSYKERAVPGYMATATRALQDYYKDRVDRGLSLDPSGFKLPPLPTPAPSPTPGPNIIQQGLGAIGGGLGAIGNMFHHNNPSPEPTASPVPRPTRTPPPLPGLPSTNGIPPSIPPIPTPPPGGFDHPRKGGRKNHGR